MARQIAIIDGLIPWLCIQATPSGSIMLKNYCFHINALGYVGNMQSINVAVGKLGPLWLMHHIHINILVRLPEADYESAFFSAIREGLKHLLVQYNRTELPMEN